MCPRIEIGIVDVHEHHLPEVLFRREVNLLQLFRQSYAGWVERRGYASPSESNSNPELALDEPTSWDSLAP
jgi:hypothetical protein